MILIHHAPQFLVIPHRFRNVFGGDTRLNIIVVASFIGRVARQFEDLGSQIFQHGGHVNGGPRAHAGGVLSVAEVVANAIDGKVQSGLGRRAESLWEYK